MLPGVRIAPHFAGRSPAPRGPGTAAAADADGTHISGSNLALDLGSVVDELRDEQRLLLHEAIYRAHYAAGMHSEGRRPRDGSDRRRAEGESTSSSPHSTLLRFFAGEFSMSCPLSGVIPWAGASRGNTKFSGLFKLTRQRQNLTAPLLWNTKKSSHTEKNLFTTTKIFHFR